MMTNWSKPWEILGDQFVRALTHYFTWLHTCAIAAYLKSM